MDYFDNSSFIRPDLNANRSEPVSVSFINFERSNGTETGIRHEFPGVVFLNGRDVSRVEDLDSAMLLLRFAGSLFPNTTDPTPVRMDPEGNRSELIAYLMFHGISNSSWYPPTSYLGQELITCDTKTPQRLSEALKPGYHFSSCISQKGMNSKDVTKYKTLLGNNDLYLLPNTFSDSNISCYQEKLRMLRHCTCDPPNPSLYKINLIRDASKNLQHHILEIVIVVKHSLSGFPIFQANSLFSFHPPFMQDPNDEIEIVALSSEHIVPLRRNGSVLAQASGYLIGLKTQPLQLEVLSLVPLRIKPSSQMLPKLHDLKTSENIPKVLSCPSRPTQHTVYSAPNSSQILYIDAAFLNTTHPVSKLLDTGAGTGSRVPKYSIAHLIMCDYDC